MGCSYFLLVVNSAVLHIDVQTAVWLPVPINRVAVGVSGCLRTFALATGE